MKCTLTITLLLAAVLCLARPAGSCDRPYVFTYPYNQSYPGETEIEIYSDWNVDADSRGSARYQVEVAHGFTEDYMAGVYADFRDQGAGRGLELKQLKLVNRFHLAPWRKNAFNPALYLEYKKSTETASKDALEGKLILTRDFGKWSFSTNLMWNSTLNGKSSPSFEYTAGVAREYRPSQYYALELKAAPEKNEYYLVPATSLTLGKSARLNVGVGKGLTSSSSDYIVRTIFAWEL